MYLMQTGQNLIRHCFLQHLIWVYTVSQCPIYGTRGLNGLSLIYIIVLIKINAIYTVKHLNLMAPNFGTFHFYLLSDLYSSRFWIPPPPPRPPTTPLPLLCMQALHIDLQYSKDSKFVLQLIKNKQIHIT